MDCMQMLVKAITDEFKDAEMLYDYGKTLKEKDETELANFFINRAQVRLKMMEEDNAWLQKHCEETNNKEFLNNNYFYNYFIDEMATLKDRLASLK